MRAMIIVAWVFCPTLLASKINDAPPEKPMVYYHLAKASHVAKPQDYLDRAFERNRFRVIEKAITHDLGRWHYLLIVDEMTNQSIVSFRGTKGLRNWLSNVRNFFRQEHGLLSEINLQLREWNRSLQKAGRQPISVLIGHSRGGHFAYAAQSDEAVLRITFNGYACKCDDESGVCRRINLRNRGDIISGWPFSKRKHYITIHSLAKKPGIRKRLLQTPHCLLSAAQAMVKNPECARESWTRNPIPLDDRGWHEIAPDYFLPPQAIPDI